MIQALRTVGRGLAIGAAAAALFGVMPAKAAPVSLNFTVTGSSGTLGSGTVSYDDAAVAATGSSNLTAGSGNGSLLISFTSSIAGLSGPFTQADDDFSAATLGFQDGVLLGLNYLVTSVSSPAGFGFASSIDSLSNTSLLMGFDPGMQFGYFTGTGFGEGRVSFFTVQPPGTVVEPASLALAALALTGMGWVQRRRDRG